MRKLELIPLAVMLFVSVTGLRTTKTDPKTCAHAENERLTKQNEAYLHKPTATQLTTDRSHCLVEYTKSSVHGNQSNCAGFESVESQLWETLNDIHLSVRREAPHMKALTTQVTDATSLVRNIMKV